MLGKFTAFLVYLITISSLAAGKDPKASEVLKLASGLRASLTLQGADGQMHRPLSDRNQKATVLVFLMHDCPVTNGTAPELARLAKDFTPRGVEFFRVYVSEDAAEIQTHGRDYGLRFPGLLDRDLKLASAVGATRAPEAAVISADGVLLYRGRIDDRAAKPGITRPTASQHDLGLALDAVLAGRKPEPRFTTAIGCYLPTK